MTLRSPKPSIEKPSTGLPDLAIPSTMRFVQFGSMPMTTTAEMLGLDPTPMSVRKVSSRSSPNCSRPNACGSASVPGTRAATPSAAALERSSTGSTAT